MYSDSDSSEEEGCYPYITQVNFGTARPDATWSQHYGHSVGRNVLVPDQQPSATHNHDQQPMGTVPSDWNLGMQHSRHAGTQLPHHNSSVGGESRYPTTGNRGGTAGEEVRWVKVGPNQVRQITLTECASRCSSQATGPTGLPLPDELSRYQETFLSMWGARGLSWSDVSGIDISRDAFSGQYRDTINSDGTFPEMVLALVRSMRNMGAEDWDAVVRAHYKAFVLGFTIATGLLECIQCLDFHQPNWTQDHPMPMWSPTNDPCYIKGHQTLMKTFVEHTRTGQHTHRHRETVVDARRRWARTDEIRARYLSAIRLMLAGSPTRCIEPLDVSRTSMHGGQPGNHNRTDQSCPTAGRPNAPNTARSRPHNRTGHSRSAAGRTSAPNPTGSTSRAQAWPLTGFPRSNRQPPTRETSQRTGTQATRPRTKSRGSAVMETDVIEGAGYSTDDGRINGESAVCTTPNETVEAGRHSTSLANATAFVPPARPLPPSSVGENYTGTASQATGFSSKTPLPNRAKRKPVPWAACGATKPKATAPTSDHCTKTPLPDRAKRKPTLWAADGEQASTQRPQSDNVARKPQRAFANGESHALTTAGTDKATAHANAPTAIANDNNTGAPSVIVTNQPDETPSHNGTASNANSGRQNTSPAVRPLFPRMSAKASRELKDFGEGN